MSAAATPRGTLAADGDLLERSSYLAELAGRFDDVVRGRARAARVRQRRGRRREDRAPSPLLRRPSAGRASSGERATRSSRHARSGRCSTSPRARAASSSSSSSGALRPGRSRGPASRARHADADDRRARGPALGRRGDARRPPAGRQEDRGSGGARRRQLPRRRARAVPSAPRRSRRARDRRPRRPAPLLPLSREAVGVLAAATRRRRGRALRDHGREPVLRHRGTRRGRRRPSRRPCATRYSRAPRG